MANEVLFVQYAGNQPVKIETHYIGELERRRPLSDVADLIRAVKQELSSKLGAIDPDDLTLHMPAGVARSASGLSDNCFLTEDENDTALDPACKLCDLVPNTLGVNSKKPLIIEARN
ncbi:hypothetical protein HDU82_003688, partial [Entophlyctis luteolus]